MKFKFEIVLFNRVKKVKTFIFCQFFKNINILIKIPSNNYLKLLCHQRKKEISKTKMIRLKI